VRRKVLIGFLIGSLVGVLLLASCCGGLFGFRALLHHGIGPPREAEVRRLWVALEALPGPEGVQETLNEADGKRFRNGEWVVGVGIDSHSWAKARDTVVVRDSRGRLRAFVGGHVCGPHWLGQSDFLRASSLEDFDMKLANQGFVEYQPPEQDSPSP
jgi:hypothetical protein